MDLAINNVISLCNFMGKLVCVCVCIRLLSTFITLLPFKIHLTNTSPILIKMVDFKNLACATSSATRASRKFIYLPYRANGEKKEELLSYPGDDFFIISTKSVTLLSQPLSVPMIRNLAELKVLDCKVRDFGLGLAYHSPWPLV